MGVAPQSRAGDERTVLDLDLADRIGGDFIPLPRSPPAASTGGRDPRRRRRNPARHCVLAALAETILSTSRSHWASRLASIGSRTPPSAERARTRRRQTSLSSGPRFISSQRAFVGSILETAPERGASIPLWLGRS